MEFLIQYDTESIIVDWHRVLTDTIRQLVRNVEDGNVSLRTSPVIICICVRSTRTTLLTRRTETRTTRSAAPTPLETTGSEAAPTSVDVGCTVDVIGPDPVGTAASVYKCLKRSSQQSERHTFIQLCGGHRPKEGPHQADEVPHETPHAAVCQGEGIHPR